VQTQTNGAPRTRLPDLVACGPCAPSHLAAGGACAPVAPGGPCGPTNPGTAKTCVMVICIAPPGHFQQKEPVGTGTGDGREHAGVRGIVDGELTTMSVIRPSGPRGVRWFAGSRCETEMVSVFARSRPGPASPADVVVGLGDVRKPSRNKPTNSTNLCEQTTVASFETLPSALHLTHLRELPRKSCLMCGRQFSHLPPGKSRLTRSLQIDRPHDAHGTATCSLIRLT